MRELRRAQPGASEAQLKSILTGMWAEASDSERKEMERRSELDKVRYEREAAEYRSEEGAAGGVGRSLRYWTGGTHASSSRSRASSHVSRSRV